MNRWHVYEWLKESYMFSGIVPTIHAVRSHFFGQIDREELLEGIMEFQLTTGVQIPAERGEQLVKNIRD